MTRSSLALASPLSTALAAPAFAQTATQPAGAHGQAARRGDPPQRRRQRRDCGRLLHDAGSSGPIPCLEACRREHLQQRRRECRRGERVDRRRDRQSAGRGRRRRRLPRHRREERRPAVRERSNGRMRRARRLPTPIRRPAPATTPAPMAPAGTGATTDTTGAVAAAPAPKDYPDHGIIDMTKDQLQNAPQFKYVSEK